MPLYPTLEDLKVDEVLTEQEKQNITSRVAEASQSFRLDLKDAPISYSAVSNYMGVNLRYYYDEKGDLVFAEQDMICPQPLPAGNSAPASAHHSNTLVNVPTKPPGSIKSGVRRIRLCKDATGKVGLQFRSIDSGIFVCFVAESSPAALGGVKFGDQIVEINHNYLAGKTPKDVADIIRHANVGMIIRRGRITSIVKDSSAARNGVLTSHQIVEMNGQNIIGLSDSVVSELISAAGECITITIMPAPIYETMIKQLGKSQIKREMDHSIPDA